MKFKLENPEHQRTAIRSEVETLLYPSFGTPLLLLWSPCDEKVVHALVVLVLADQHLYLVVIEPVAFPTIKEVKGLGEQLTVVHVVLEVDHARSLHADEAARAGGIGERLHLVGGTDERGVAAVLLNGLAIGRAKLPCFSKSSVQTPFSLLFSILHYLYINSTRFILFSSQKYTI